MLEDAARWDLPWPRLLIPPYREMTLGMWSIRRMAPVPQWRYFHAELISAGQYTLLAGDESWMSTAPIEIEGQAQHVAAAHGHVVVMGAGLGVVLYNLLRKRQVTHVTLVECDPDVITLLRQAADLDSWDGIEKLTCEIGDAFEYHSPMPVDTLYMDIWPSRRTRKRWPIRSTFSVTLGRVRWGGGRRKCFSCTGWSNTATI